jgi:hypothetical protein
MSANKEVRVTFRGIDKTRTAFSKIRQNFKQLQGQLSKVSFGFGKIGTALTAAFSATALKKIIDSGAEIGRLSHKLDANTRSLSELKYAAGACGVEFTTLTSGLQEMASRTAEAAKGTGDAAQGLKLLGLSAKELNAISPDQQFEQIADRLMGVADSAVKAHLAVKLFGSEGAKLLPLLEQGSEGIRKFQEEARKLGLSLSSEDCKAMTKFNEEIAKLQAVMTGLMTSVLIPILPAITAFFAAIHDGHPAITFIVTVISTLLAFRLAAWFIEASVAVRAFTVALAANPLGLVAVAISTTVAALVSLRQWFRKSTESAAEYNKTIAKTIELSNISIPSQQKSIEVLSKRNELQMEAKRIFEQTRTPLEKHNAEMEKLNKLLKEGLIDQDTYNRAMQQSSGALNDTAAESEGLFSMIESRSNEASKSLIDNFADSTFGIRGEVKSLKDTFNDFFSQLQSDMLKMSLKQGMQGLLGGGGISGMLGGLFGGGSARDGGMGGFGSMFAGFFAGGGRAKAGKAHVVGDGGEPELFIPSSSGTVVPFSELENGKNSSPNITVNMNIQTPDLASFNYSRSQIAADMARQISRSSRNL